MKIANEGNLNNGLSSYNSYRFSMFHSAISTMHLNMTIIASTTSWSPQSGSQLEITTGTQPRIHWLVNLTISMAQVQPTSLSLESMPPHRLLTLIHGGALLLARPYSLLDARRIQTRTLVFRTLLWRWMNINSIQWKVWNSNIKSTRPLLTSLLAWPQFIQWYIKTTLSTRYYRIKAMLPLIPYHIHSLTPLLSYSPKPRNNHPSNDEHRR